MLAVLWRNLLDRQIVHCGRLISVKFVGKSHPLDRKKPYKLAHMRMFTCIVKTLLLSKTKSYVPEPSNGLLYFAPKTKSARVPRGKGCDRKPHDLQFNHNCNKIVKSDWLTTALISALIGQFNRTVRAITRALKWLFFHC